MGIVPAAAMVNMSGPEGLGGCGEGEDITHLLMRGDSGQRLLLKNAHQLGETALRCADRAGASLS